MKCPYCGSHDAVWMYRECSIGFVPEIPDPHFHYTCPDCGGNWATPLFPRPGEEKTNRLQTALKIVVVATVALATLGVAAILGGRF